MIPNPFRKFDLENMKHSSDQLNQSMDFSGEVSKRLIIFAVIIGLLFSAVFVRLFQIQVLQHEEYTIKMENYNTTTQASSTPRGQIYDRNGKVIAATVVSHNIIYTQPEEITTAQRWELAQKFASAFDVDKNELSKNQRKDLYIFKHTLLDSSDPSYACNDLLTQEELNSYRNGSWGDDKESRRTEILYERITDDMLEEELSDEEEAGYVVYARMISGTSGQSKTILEDVDDDTVAYLVEHKSSFPGFDIDLGSWKREYPYGDTLRDVLGNVTTSTQGVPAELADYYQALGYPLNARVGSSGLEYQYEGLLSGTQKVSSVEYDEEGNAVIKEETSGKKGYDVYLTIDIELQQELDKVVKETLESAADNQYRQNFTTLFVCLMNPKTGEIYAMSGYQRDKKTNKVTPFASGNYLSYTNPGSIVKGATLYMGLNEGVVKPGEVINDAPMYISGTPVKASYKNYGPVDDVKALQVSSNVYMFHIAIRLAGSTYVPYQSLGISDPSSTFSLMRSYYSMFGLGNVTGLDVPNEVGGYVGYSTEAGKLLDFAIGQYDMYTPIQILQYVSTIANDGTTVKPHLFSYATEVNSTNVVTSYQNQVVSTLSGNLDYLDRVQQGFRACVSSGYCGDAANSLEEDIAGKTGTAEVGDSTSTAFIGYGPYEDPSMAFACVAPTSSDTGSNLQSNVCTTEVMGPVLEKYFSIMKSDDAQKK
ncbi:peptidoglycan D,D-transpeptidase FtsI family protein [Merdibacter massiliensis]|uniref:peptidoglycan D,D-transpeptidase FtsI family protein n=1 Tax=Merdibacter massiliensis TaxID=1871030 RepID=UPI00096A4E24|nr:penicillin-binding protein 2 [Merdibacter massiliensis]